MRETYTDATASALHSAVVANPAEVTPRLVLADRWQELGRDDVAAMWRGVLPARRDTRPRVDAMTDAERAMMPAWVGRWTKVGLSTEPADRPMFEAAATRCYVTAKLNPPRLVWCPNPLATVLAGATYACRAVGGAVRDAVGGAVGDAVGDAVDVAVGGAVRRLWWRRFGGQFWVGGWWSGPAYTTFMLDVLRLALPDHLELAARAYAGTCESACWWWPHRDVVFVSERPHTIEVRQGLTPVVRWEGWGIG